MHFLPFFEGLLDDLPVGRCLTQTPCCTSIEQSVRSPTMLGQLCVEVILMLLQSGLQRGVGPEYICNITSFGVSIPSKQQLPDLVGACLDSRLRLDGSQDVPEPLLHLLPCAILVVVTFRQRQSQQATASSGHRFSSQSSQRTT